MGAPRTQEVTMRMRRRLALVMAMAMLAVAVGAVSASADVERYQFTDYELNVTEVNGITAYAHMFDVRYDPSTDAYEGSGTYSNGTETESLSNFDMTLGTLSFQSDYDDADPEYTWFPSFILNVDWSMTFVDGYGADNVTAAEGTYTATDTEYKNHGQYVKDADDKKAAAHSLIGMPVQSQKKNK
jgi:hypothetical protein